MWEGWGRFAMPFVVDRRRLLGALGGACLPGRTEATVQSSLRRVAWLGTTSPVSDDIRFFAFKEALSSFGLVEGNNTTIKRHFWTKDAVELEQTILNIVAESPEVIVVPTAGIAFALRAKTSSIPIVTLSAGSLEGTGLIDNIQRPGGNVTGIQLLSPGLMSKRISLLSELIPELNKITYVEPVSPGALIAPAYYEYVLDAAARSNIQILSTKAYRAEDFEAAYKEMSLNQSQAALIIGNPLSNGNAKLIAQVAAEYKVPTMHEFESFVKAGGLISYGPNQREFPRIVAEYVKQILSGTSPGSLPVRQPTEYILALNLRAATALGLKVPDMLLARADQVIE